MPAIVLTDAAVNMDESIHTITSTLLAKARAHEAPAWERLVDVYSPLVYHWCLQKGLSREDSEDVGQQVFVAVSRALGDYEHETFRGWLRTITNRKILDFWEQRKKQPAGEGGTSFQVRVNEWPAPSSDQELATDREERQILRRSVLEAVCSEFSQQDLEAFRRVVVDEHSPAEVAQALGISRNQVYLAKSRILKRLREAFGPSG